MYRVFEGEKHFLPRPLGWLERLVYRLCGVDRAGADLDRYTVALLAFSVFTHARDLRHPAAAARAAASTRRSSPRSSRRSAFNTAASFTTNTNWQGYAGEVDDELPDARWRGWPGTTSPRRRPASASRWRSPAASPAAAARTGAKTLGNFWVDLIRATVYVLLPLCVVFALVFVSQGVIQNLAPYLEVTTLEGAQADASRMGPVASQEAIKQLGHQRRRLLQRQQRAPVREPERRSPTSCRCSSIFADPGGAHLHVRPDGARPAAGLGALRRDDASCSSPASPSPTAAEAARQPGRCAACPSPRRSATWRARRSRFGVASSALFATVTTDASCGAVNAMHDSFTPLGGLVPLVNIQLGEVVFGGVGAGLYGMLVMVVLARVHRRPDGRAARPSTWARRSRRAR